MQSSELTFASLFNELYDTNNTYSPALDSATYDTLVSEFPLANSPEFDWLSSTPPCYATNPAPLQMYAIDGCIAPSLLLQPPPPSCHLPPPSIPASDHAAIVATPRQRSASSSPRKRSSPARRSSKPSSVRDETGFLIWEDGYACLERWEGVTIASIAPQCVENLCFIGDQAMAVGVLLAKSFPRNMQRLKRVTNIFMVFRMFIKPAIEEGIKARGNRPDVEGNSTVLNGEVSREASRLWREHPEVQKSWAPLYDAYAVKFKLMTAGFIRRLVDAGDERYLDEEEEKRKRRRSRGSSSC